MLLLTKEQTSTIKGELYKVDDNGLQTIDRIEGHPRLYKREEVQVVVNGEEFKAWLYFCNEPYLTEGAETVSNGDYLTHHTTEHY